jgi:septal ring factor EnvC (AmiA/AmiB activator)
LDAEKQIEQLHAQLEQKDNTITAQQEQIKTLGGFKQEALNGRDTISSLQENLDALELSLASAVREASDARSAASAATSSASVDAKKLAAATDMAKAVKVLLGP